MLIISISVRLVFSLFSRFSLKKQFTRFLLAFPSVSLSLSLSCFSFIQFLLLLLLVLWNPLVLFRALVLRAYGPACTKRNNGESIGFRSCIFSVSWILRFSSFPRSLVIHIFVTSNRGIARALSRPRSCVVVAGSLHPVSVLSSSLQPALILFHSSSLGELPRQRATTSNDVQRRYNVARRHPTA